MFKYIFTHSCLILTLEWGAMYGRKEGGKEGREEGREEGERKPAGISSSTPLHSGWLKVKSKKQFF